MRRFSTIAVMFIALFVMASLANAQYWFQSGASGDSRSAQNYGGSVQIETVTPQHVVNGSLAYRVGESLSNGAFIQVGYEIPNQSQSLPANCDPIACHGSVYVNASQPIPFWEYFLAGVNSTDFYGSVGGDGLLGANGTFNTYSFNSSGNTWSVYVNGKKFGSVNLYASSSGANPVLAVGEYAFTNSNYFMPTVMFRDMQFYNGTAYVPLPAAYSKIGYGVGSERALANTYGVKEIGNRVNYFEVGSSIPVVNQSMRPLWSLGYTLAVNSSYGNISSKYNYTAYTTVNVSAPTYVTISPGKRAVFAGWIGTGPDSYTGSQPDISVEMVGNTTERALWNIQYYVSVTSPYGTTGGTGWQASNSTDNISVEPTQIGIGTEERVAFDSWDNGAGNSTFQLAVTDPENITAKWTTQYFVNASTPYGKIKGINWYTAGTNATLSVVALVANQTNYERTAFYEWSNGDPQNTISIPVNAPVSVNAIYANQYLVTLKSTDNYGNPINASYFIINGNETSSGFFVFPGRSYTIDSAYYKGTLLQSGIVLSNITEPTTEYMKLPVYNITIGATGFLDKPINASLNITFENNTRLSTYFGPTGSITFHDVPYGYALGAASFSGESKNVTLSNGGTVDVNFITPTIVAVTFIALILIFFTERFYFIRKERQIRKRASDRNRRRI